ncbi:MAG: sigma-70 family RNA polymerase sigma factor [Fuerstiella sp.]|nr:sigma-70 family RNA polymerase sigma factor [Fuerstiella sp.]MCP4859232.1 sigma-70 family RNA polymerase sigma factor [Fuerstiella sp.]
MTETSKTQLSSDDSYRAFMRLFTRHEGGLRCFVRTLLPSWDDVDEVMQDVSVAAWTKFGRFDPETDFARWAATIARYEVLNYRRTKARDRLVFDEDIIELLADECQDDFDRSEQERQALDGCLNQLPEYQQQLVLRVYTPGQKIKPIAEEVGVTPNALYKKLGRLRLILLRCIEDNLKGVRPEGELT